MSHIILPNVFNVKNILQLETYRIIVYMIKNALMECFIIFQHAIYVV